MSLHEQLQAARQALRNYLRAQVPSFSAAEISESILLKDGRIAGHQFQFRQLVARWIADSNRLEISLLGRPVASIDLSRGTTMDKAA